MDELSELPFEQVLSYLGLKDRLKARAVSLRWYHKINSFRVKTLCYSQRSSDFIFEKSRWVSGAFAENFINSTRFTSFFDTFGQTILSSLKWMRLCDLKLTEEDPTAFIRILNAFGQLEQLDIVRFEFDHHREFNLNLPMLTSLQLKNVYGFKKLTLEAPRLRKVTILGCFVEQKLEIVPGDSVERLLVERLEYTDVNKLKNLQYLYVADLPRAYSTLLSNLQLREIHTNEPKDVSKLFEKKRKYNLVLKIYLSGLLLNGPDDPAIIAPRYSFDYLSKESLIYLAENLSRLADEIPFYGELRYSDIEAVAPGLEVDLLKRFTNLNKMTVNHSVQDIERFLDILKNFRHITELYFHRDHPQELFDRLPEYSAIQKLSLFNPPSNLGFLFRLKHLIHLYLACSIDSETVRRAFEELPALFYFSFRYDHKDASIDIDNSKVFWVWIGKRKQIVSDLNAAIEFIFEKKRLKNRKTGVGSACSSIQ